MCRVLYSVYRALERETDKNKSCRARWSEAGTEVKMGKREGRGIYSRVVE